jgi:signal transduction histidine kinase
MDCSYEVERFRRLSAIEKIGWWEIDFFTREIICSEYLCTLLGVQESTLSFYQLGRIIWNDCRDDFRHDFLSLVREKSAYERIFPINSAHGVIWIRFRLGDVWISEDGHRKAFGILQDVSACNYSEKLLCNFEFEHFFSLISGFAKVGYAKLNLFTRDGYAIRQWYKNMGEDESTPLPRIVGVYGKMHPEDRKHVLNFYSRAREGEETYFKREMRILKAGTTDTWNWVRMHIIVTRYEPENELIELIGVNYDISELKKTEFQLIEAKEKAEAADRLKTAFLANMSHEIRTPLNAIVGFSSLLTEAGSKEEKQEYLKVVEDNNERLLRLISDILDLSRIETDKYAFHYEEVDINVLCDDVIASMRFRLQPGVRIIFKPSMLPRCLIISDCNRLQQVISNFISNAIKFTSKGFIEVGYDKPDKEHIRVYVKDTGIGIAKAECERIFDRFVKLNVFKQGSGLGLSICKSIIEQMGGTIGVNSELEKGSSFWFVLPMKRKESL